MKASIPILVKDDFMKLFRFLKGDYEAFYSDIDRMRKE
jgi:hypothetical protein